MNHRQTGEMQEQGQHGGFVPKTEYDRVDDRLSQSLAALMATVGRIEGRGGEIDEIELKKIDGGKWKFKVFADDVVHRD